MCVSVCVCVYCAMYACVHVYACTNVQCPPVTGICLIQLPVEQVRETVVSEPQQPDARRWNDGLHGGHSDWT